VNAAFNSGNSGGPLVEIDNNKSSVLLRVSLLLYLHISKKALKALKGNQIRAYVYENEKRMAPRKKSQRPKLSKRSTVSESQTQWS
jgi:hypothetical protein